MGHTSDGPGGGKGGKGGGRGGGKGGAKRGTGPGGEETATERNRRKQGLRDKDSDSDFSYRSVYSAGGKFTVIVF